MVNSGDNPPLPYNSEALLQYTPKLPFAEPVFVNQKPKVRTLFMFTSYFLFQAPKENFALGRYINGSPAEQLHYTTQSVVPILFHKKIKGLQNFLGM
jgi:hypothetical protein